MKNLYTIKPYSTLAWWIAGSIFVFPVVVVAVGATMAFLSMISLMASSFVPYALWDLASIAIFPIVGGIIALCMAVIQRWVLRSKLYWAADNWVRWSMIGGAVGAIIVGFFIWTYDSYFYRNFNEVAYLFAMPIFITTIALFQMITLRDAVKQSWLWVMSNLVAGLVFAGVVSRGTRLAGYGYDGDLSILFAAIFSVFALGMITGFTIIFLFEKKLLPMQVDNDDDLASDRTPSVWDNVI